MSQTTNYMKLVGDMSLAYNHIKEVVAAMVERLSKVNYSNTHFIIF